MRFSNFGLVESEVYAAFPLTWMLMIYCEFGNKFCIAVSEHPVIWLSKNAKRGGPLSQKIRGIPNRISLLIIDMGVSKNRGTPKMDGLIMENPWLK